LKRALLLLVALAGCSDAPLQSDWERAHVASVAQEQDVAPPAYPRAGALVAFEVAAVPGFRFFVDQASVSVDKDRIVRYVLVARSPQGIDNVTFEGMRCATREYRVYALGHADGTWSTRPTPWETLRGAAVAPARRTLARDYFCSDVFLVRDRADALAALRQPPRARQISD
jgi:hypothetical protein